MNGDGRRRGASGWGHCRDCALGDACLQTCRAYPSCIFLLPGVLHVRGVRRKRRSNLVSAADPAFLDCGCNHRPHICLFRAGRGGAESCAAQPEVIKRMATCSSTGSSYRPFAHGSFTMVGSVALSLCSAVKCRYFAYNRRVLVHGFSHARLVEQPEAPSLARSRTAHCLRPWLNRVCLSGSGHSPFLCFQLESQ